MASIRVSRHGLTCCPNCRRHVHLAADILATTCPFCSGLLVGNSGVSVPRLASMSRSAAVAAALAGWSLTACTTTPGVTDGDAYSSADANIMDVPDADSGPESDIAALPDTEIQELPYIPPGDAYGIADMDITYVPDVYSGPEYGMADIPETEIAQDWSPDAQDVYQSDEQAVVDLASTPSDTSDIKGE